MKNGGENYNLNNNKYKNDYELLHKINNQNPKNKLSNNYFPKTNDDNKTTLHIYSNTIDYSNDINKNTTIRKESIRSKYKRLLNLNNKKKTSSILPVKNIIKVNTSNILPIKVNKINKIKNEIKNNKELQINAYRIINIKNNINNRYLKNSFNTDKNFYLKDNGKENEIFESTKLKFNCLIKRINIKFFNVDEYKIIKSIGEGTYGTIYEVQNKKTNQKFAMKKVVAKDLEKLELFIKSFEIASSLKHKNIMDIMGINLKFIDANKFLLYILMPLAETDWDSSIKLRSKAKSYYKEKELISILSQIVSTMIYLKKHNIVHRDIKPENILISNNIYKLSDFGEAKITNNIIKSHSLRGTDIYMSPILYNKLKNKERKAEHDPYKSDVYSLGICFLYASELNFNTVKSIRGLKYQGLVDILVKKMMKKKYSETFVDIILNMIRIDEKERIDLYELNKLIKNYYDKNL